MISVLTRLVDRIMNRTNAHTFNRDTDSLEAIRDFLTAVSSGLIYYGVVTAIPGANQFTIPTLAGLGAGKFAGAVNPWPAFVFRDAAGASGAPQGEFQAVTAYVTATGTFTTAAYTAAVAIDDEMLIINPALSEMDLLVPAIDSIVNLLMRDVVGNKSDAQNLTAAQASIVGLLRYLVNSSGVGTIFTATASTVTTLTCAALADIAGDYVGQMIVPLAGNMQGQGMPIVGYDGTQVLTVDPGWAQAPGNIAFAIVPAYGYILIRATFDMVNAVLTTKETGGSLLTDGAVQNLYINNAPAGVYKPIAVNLDCTVMAAGDSIQVRIYYRIGTGLNLIMQDDFTLNGVQAPALKTITLQPNRFGVQVTIQRLAGVDRTYPWGVIYED